VVVVVCALLLINIGSSTAFFAILSLTTVALYISYIIPIFFIILWKIRGAHIPYGPIRLGRWGLPINLLALCYGIFIVIWLPFPPYMPVTASNMNYGGPVVGAVILFALIDWFVSGKNRFVPPVEKHTDFL
jgi:choline transport protein